MPASSGFIELHRLVETECVELITCCFNASGKKHTFFCFGFLMVGKITVDLKHFNHNNNGLIKPN